MKLYGNSASPYVRKVLVLAQETGLADRLDKETARPTPLSPEPRLSNANPLGKVPCLLLDSGQALFDSRVICEYLDRLHGGRRFVPTDGIARWTALTRQALADGIMDAAVMTRYEQTLRPQDLRWEDWITAQKGKIRDALDRLEDEATTFEGLPDIGHVAVAVALGYLDFRFADDGWRDGRPQLKDWYEAFAQRPSMQVTRPG